MLCCLRIRQLQAMAQIMISSNYVSTPSMKPNSNLSAKTELSR